MASLAFLGIFFLVLFAGMGMSALPIDLIRSYRTRPTFVRHKLHSKWEETLTEIYCLKILDFLKASIFKESLAEKAVLDINGVRR